MCGEGEDEGEEEKRVEGEDEKQVERDEEEVKATN